MFRRKKYHISYTTQTGISDVLFSSEIIDIRPSVWILSKGSSGNVKYSLISWSDVGEDFPNRCLLTYVTQSSINDFSFKTEIIRGNPYQWIQRKNEDSAIKYTVLNWSELS